MRRFLIPLMFLPGTLWAEVPKVVTDIAPVHGLVSMVMDGAGAPDLLLPPGASPHHYTMRPSEARMIADADIIVWVGHGLTPWLEAPLESLGTEAQHLTLMDLEGTKHLTWREAAVFEDHDHDHDHDHGHEDEGKEDPHVWLDPENAALWLTAIADSLSAADPVNEALYRLNATTAQQKIEKAADAAADGLTPLRDRPFLVLHDGFQYFETYFGLTAWGAVSDGEAESPGASRLRSLRAEMAEGEVVCALSEAQANASLLETVVEGSDVKLGIIDPVGADIPLGVGHYPMLITAIAQSFEDCLTP